MVFSDGLAVVDIRDSLGKERGEARDGLVFLCLRGGIVEGKGDGTLDG